MTTAAKWKELEDKAKAEKKILCKHFDGQVVLTGICLYAAIHSKMEEMLQQNTAEDQISTIEETLLSS
jgi:glutamine amidotransferase-like uncharacterized protein